MIDRVIVVFSQQFNSIAAKLAKYLPKNLSCGLFYDETQYNQSPKAHQTSHQSQLAWGMSIE
jgi:hypothetical protein